MKPRSLYRRIYMHFLAVLIGVGALSAWVFSHGPQRTWVVETADRLAAYTAALIAREPTEAARIAVASQLADELKLDLTLTDATGRVLLRRGNLPSIDHEDRSLIAATVRLRDRRWFVVAPVNVPGGPQLTLACTMHGLHNEWPVRPAVTLVAFLVVIAMGVRPLARRISRPIERLIVASRRFGEGDLSTRVELPHARHHRHKWRRNWRRRHLGDELFTLMHAWNDMAERIERQVGSQRELLANVSHELRSPLARVRVALALLPSDAPTQQRITDIEADLGELDALIEQILQTSRLEATGLTAHRERFAVSALFDEVIARANADPFTAKLGVQIDPGQGARAAWLDGDRALLRRALFNLVENAAKYGAPPVELAVERGDGISLVVRDAGPGIAPEDRQSATQPFWRGDRAHTPGRGGVGLGLSFAAKVAEVHGGTLTIDGGPDGQGAIIRLRLPADRVLA